MGHLWAGPQWGAHLWEDPLWVAQIWEDLIWVDLTWADLTWVDPTWAVPRNKFQCHIPALSRHRVEVLVLQCGTQAQVAILDAILAATRFTMGTFRWGVGRHTPTRQCSPLP